MSYIRMSQEGQYVDIPKGSKYYLYDNGRNIEGWSYGEFGALIGQVADEIDIGEDEATSIKAGFRAHFEGWDEDYDGGVSPPERGEIFCQCVDSRIEGLELTDSLQSAVQEWVESHDVLKECEYCGDEFRPYIDTGGTYVCSKDECGTAHSADTYNVTIDVMKNERRVFEELMENYGFSLREASDLSHDYLLEQSPRSFNEEAEELTEE